MDQALPARAAREQSETIRLLYSSVIQLQPWDDDQIRTTGHMFLFTHIMTHNDYSKDKSGQATQAQTERLVAEAGRSKKGGHHSDKTTHSFYKNHSRTCLWHSSFHALWPFFKDFKRMSPYESKNTSVCCNLGIRSRGQTRTLSATGFGSQIFVSTVYLCSQENWQQTDFALTLQTEVFSLVGNRLSRSSMSISPHFFSHMSQTKTCSIVDLENLSCDQCTRHAGTGRLMGKGHGE